jgi:hypothetical protein
MLGGQKSGFLKTCGCWLGSSWPANIGVGRFLLMLVGIVCADGPTECCDTYSGTQMFCMQLFGLVCAPNCSKCNPTIDLEQIEDFWNGLTYTIPWLLSHNKLFLHFLKNRVSELK